MIVSHVYFMGLSTVNNCLIACQNHGYYYSPELFYKIKDVEREIERERKREREGKRGGSGWEQVNIN